MRAGKSDLNWKRSNAASLKSNKARLFNGNGTSEVMWFAADDVRLKHVSPRMGIVTPECVKLLDKNVNLQFAESRAISKGSKQVPPDNGDDNFNRTRNLRSRALPATAWSRTAGEDSKHNLPMTDMIGLDQVETRTNKRVSGWKKSRTDR